MRTLCLNLKTSLSSASVEKFVCFSPRVCYREPGLLFIDIESTAHLFGGEAHVLRQSLQLAERFTTEVFGAIADHPFTAQVLAMGRFSSTSLPGMDSNTLAPFPLEALLHLEGLKPWSHRGQTEEAIAFFLSVGLQSIGELNKIQLSQMRARWGEFGITLWKRLHLKEEQVISPLKVTDSLYGYGYFEPTLEHLPLLMRELTKSLENLFAQMERMGRFGKQLKLTLHCDYSNVQHKLEVEPVNPSRDLNLFIDLLEKKLQKLDLLNPVREFEIELADVPEKIFQMDFFDVVDPAVDKWRRLISFTRQMGVDVGFLQPLPSHYPEESFQFRSDWPSDHNPQDFIVRENDAIQVRSVYAKGLAKSPRPPLLLKQPLALPQAEVRSLRFMSSLPCERIEGAWWEDWKNRWKQLVVRTSQQRAPARDYYFAISAKGQWLWIFQDHQTKRYYLHGYFD